MLHLVSINPHTFETDDTSINSPTDFHHTKNEYTIDDDIQYNTPNINEISDHASFEMKDDLNIQRTLIDLFGEYSVNYLFFHHESLILNSGCKAIIAICLTEKSLHSFISDFDVDLHFNILKDHTALSQRQRRLLANVFSSFVCTSMIHGRDPCCISSVSICYTYLDSM